MSRLYVPIFVLAACAHPTASTEQHANLCDPSACEGSNPYGAPNYECADGTIAGPACIEAADGSCDWGIVECASDEDCAIDACGTAPGIPNWTCPDGSIGGPACLHAASGECGWRIIECPEPAPCAWDDCPAPAPGAPNFLCDDGETIGGPACQPAAGGGCAWAFVECPAGG